MNTYKNITSYILVSLGGYKSGRIYAQAKVAFYSLHLAYREGAHNDEECGASLRL